MRTHRTLTLLALAAFVLLLAAPWAHARGGRSSAPAAGPPAAGTSSPADAPAAPAPPPEPGPAPDPSAGDSTPPPVADSAFAGRVRRTRAKAPGLGDWIYWYEANREEFEDLRRGTLLTEANPLFALGEALGERVGRIERRLKDDDLSALRTAVKDVVRGSGGHWVYTEGAAYVALGKIASDPVDVEFLTRALRADPPLSEFVRESAVLGLGQLHRSDARRQLSVTILDRARDALEDILDDSDAPARTRAFAAVSLGLLSDQPSGKAGIGPATATRLLSRWMEVDLADETQVGLLIGLGLHRPADVGAVVRLALRGCAARGRLGSRRCSALVRAHAALALARVGSEGDAAALLDLLGDRVDATPKLRQAAAIGAGLMGRRLAGTRLRLGTALLAARARGKDPSSRNLCVMALGRILGAEAKVGRDTLLQEAKAGTRLLDAAQDGRAHERAFAALALSLAIRPVDERIESALWQEFRVRALKTLRAGLGDRKLAGHARAAFATATGLAYDGRSRPALIELVADVDVDPDLRAHAALALGLLGEARERVVATVGNALKDARSDMLRMRAATAIGLLGGGKQADRDETIGILIEQLRATRNQNVKGQIAITLARIGDGRSVAPLLAMLLEPAESHMNRSLACAALGLLGDEEQAPVLSESRRDSHYMSGSSVVYDLLDIL